MNATNNNGRLRRLSDRAFIQFGSNDKEISEGGDRHYFNNIPDLGDSKGASYTDEPGFGRASPIKIYNTSDNRSISCSVSLFVQDKSDCKKNLRILRKIQSAVYPRRGVGVPYYPPVLCRIQCGSLLSENTICCVMKNYNVKFPTDVPWDAETLCPYKMEVSMDFDQVFASQNLPNQELILQDVPL